MVSNECTRCGGFGFEPPDDDDPDERTYPCQKCGELNPDRLTVDSSNEPRIATPQEAQVHKTWPHLVSTEDVGALAHTVATEPDRTRAAVVKALRDAAPESPNFSAERWLILRADAIENGADL